MEFVGHVHRRRLAMEAEPAQTITAEELDVRLRFMMATRGNVTGPFVVRASRTLLRMWDAVCGKPINNEQHIKQNNIGTKTLQKRVKQHSRYMGQCRVTKADIG